MLPAAELETIRLARNHLRSQERPWIAPTQGLDSCRKEAKIMRINGKHGENGGNDDLTHDNPPGDAP